MMAAKIKTKALAYLRVSGKSQVEGDGFTRQRQAIDAYARPRGIDIVAEYRDEGVSGTKELERRDGLAALVDQVAANGARLVLVERADRLARDLLVGEILLGQFRKLGVQVIAADSGTDLTVDDGDATKKLIRQVLGAVAEFEKTTVVLKLRAARDRIRRRAGRCEGRKPYGSRPGEREIVERIRQLRRKRPNGRPMSFAAIAQTLNAEGIPTRYGQAWQPSTIRGILVRARGRTGTVGATAT